MTYYLAYGSNLHPLRLKQRGVAARLVGAVTLPGYELLFVKRSVDGSAKCTIFPSAQNRTIHGVLYFIKSEQMLLLDEYEGLGKGYEYKNLLLDVNNRQFKATTYVASDSHIEKELKPYHWYKDLVLAGARYHGFPGHYIAAIEALGSIADPDADRQMENECLLALIADFPHKSGLLD